MWRKGPPTTKRNVVNMHYPCSVNHNSPYTYSFILFLLARRAFLTLPRQRAGMQRKAHTRVGWCMGCGRVEMIRALFQMCARKKTSGAEWGRKHVDDAGQRWRITVFHATHATNRTLCACLYKRLKLVFNLCAYIKLSIWEISILPKRRKV